MRVMHLILETPILLTRSKKARTVIVFFVWNLIGNHSFDSPSLVSYLDWCLYTMALWNVDPSFQAILNWIYWEMNTKRVYLLLC